VAQEAPDTVLMAGDEASLYLQATVKVVWHAKGQTPMIRLHPGRDSTHFYGGLDLKTGRAITLRSPIMNAAISVLFLLRVLDAFPGLPILLFWDRAPWHRGPAIRQVLEEHPRLEIIYYPAGAPDLNPQEFVWKATRNAISHNHRHKKLAELADAFEQHLTSTLFPCSLLEKHDYPRLWAMFN
jgi:transposase